MDDLKRELTQLEIDILKNAEHRLNLWLKDTFMRCDAVELGDIAGGCLAFAALLKGYIEMAGALNIGEDTLAGITRSALRAYLTRTEAKNKFEKYPYNG